MPEELRARVIAAYDTEGARTRGELDDLVSFAAQLCQVPIALITVVSGQEQRLLAAHGTDLLGTPRDISFCAYALSGTDLLVVPDLTQDARFAHNPLVSGDTALRFYAGAPMVTAEGVVIGTVCVLDREPREGLTALQRQGMAVLARAAMARLDDVRIHREHGMVRAESARVLAESERRFQTLADSMPQMVWSTLPDGFHDYYNARWYEFTGVPPGSTDGEGWNDVFHPDDQARAWTTWRHSLTTGEPYQIEYRLKHVDGTYRWVLGRALPMHDADGQIIRWFGTCTDIHEQKLAQEEREVISQELSHRIKNIFAVIAGLIQFAARTRPEFAPAAVDLRQRVTALGRAHDFVRPHSAQSRPEAQQDSLHGLLAALFDPYQQRDRQRVQLTGDDLVIDDRSATPLALLFHELATNATKYGALSTETGNVFLDIKRHDGDVVLTWTERGGPTVIAPEQDSTGFGSQLIELSAVRQLGGSVERHWHPDGLAVTIRLPRTSFNRH